MRRRGRRSRRVLDPIQVRRVLDSLGENRRLLNGLMGQLPVRGPEYLAAEAIVNAINDLAENLTGCRDHFWSKAPSTSQHP
jgi:hypothetical protein